MHGIYIYIFFFLGKMLKLLYQVLSFLHKHKDTSSGMHAQRITTREHKLIKHRGRLLPPTSQTGTVFIPLTRGPYRANGQEGYIPSGKRTVVLIRIPNAKLTPYHTQRSSTTSTLKATYRKDERRKNRQRGAPPSNLQSPSRGSARPHAPRWTHKAGWQTTTRRHRKTNARARRRPTLGITPRTAPEDYHETRKRVEEP